MVGDGPPCHRPPLINSITSTGQNLNGTDGSSDHTEDFADANRIEKLLSITFILINMLTGLA